MGRIRMSRSSQSIGIFWAGVSVLCWGTLFPAASYLLKRGHVDCYSMSQFRFLVAGVAMLVVLAVMERRFPWAGLGKADWIQIILYSVFAGGMSVSLFLGQSLGIPVVNASMLEAEAPLMIFVLGLVILRNKTSIVQFAGLVFGFAGSLLVLKAIHAHGLAIKSITTGDVVVFIGAAFWALYTVLSNRTIKRIGGLRYSAWSLLFAGLWILLFQLITGHPVNIPHEWPDMLCLLYLGLIPSALAFFSWNNAQRYISTGLLAMSGYFTPILTALLGWMLFGETVTFMQCLGMVLVFGSALIEPEIAAMIRFPRTSNPPRSQ